MVSANAYGKSGMQKEAIEAYKQAIRIDPEKVKELFKLINK
jgi:cytochrome c-type biogenesis protein CcmH/NrfG